MATQVTQAGSASNLRVLLVGQDPTLADECRQALSALSDRRAVLYIAESTRDAIALAGSRQPHFVIAEVGDNLEEVADLSKAMHEVVPGVVVAVTYETSRLHDGGSDGSLIIELLRADVRDFLRRPLSPVELAMVLERLLSARPHTSARAGHVVSFISNKGGVGKSTLAVNTACTLALRHPGQVLLVDASLQLGICAMMLGIRPTATILDAIRERERLDEVLLRGLTMPHDSGLRLLAAPADAIEAADIGDEGFARLLYLARRSFDYTVVDTFPMLDSVVMAALDASDLTFVVLQGTAPGVAGISRLLPVLEGLGFPSDRQRVVLNRNHKRFLGDLTTGDVERSLSRPVDHVIPYDRGVLVSMNTGVPHALHAHRWNGFVRAVGRIVDALEQFTGEPAQTPGDAADTDAAESRAQRASDKRSGFERRLKDLGRAAGDRRSGRDRRATTVRSPLEMEVVQ